MEKDRKFLHCPPHEGIGREEATDVRKHIFILLASGPCVITYGTLKTVRLAAAAAASSQ